MKKSRIKKLIKQEWIERTFYKKYSPYNWWSDLYYKNNEEGC